MSGGPTKARELGILDRAIAELGPNSYLAPWLSSQRAAIETDLRCDHFPTVYTFAEYRAEACRIREAAEFAGQEIRQAAERQAAAIVERGRREAEDIRRYARKAIEQYAAEVNAMGGVR
jgi:cell division septum initiation protein DivIVA